MAQNIEKTNQIRDYNGFAKALKSGDTGRLYLIYGNESYLIKKALKALTKIYISSGGEELDYYEADWDARTMTPDRVYELFSTPSFLSPRRMVVLRGSNLLYGKSPDSSGTWDAYLAVLDRITDMSCLVFIEDRIDKRKKSLVESFLKMGEIIQIDQQKPEDLCKWVGVLLSRQKIQIAIDAVHSLVDRTEMNMFSLENEVNKIILYCKYNTVTEVGMKEIDRICIPDLRGSIFQMTDAIGAQNYQTALQILDRLIALREPVTRIRFMLARHIRQLICAKELGQAPALATALKTPPYIAQKILKQARGFELEKLTDLYLFCAERDYQVKTGQIEERTALETFLCSFSV